MQFLVPLIVGAALAHAAENPPVRLAVEAVAKSVAVGQFAALRIELRDAYNNKTPAPKVYDVVVSRGREVALKAAIPPGRHSVEVKVPMPKTGIFLIKATHPELREDAIYIRVLRVKAPLKTRTPLLVPASWQEPAFAQAPNPSGPLELRLLYSSDGAKPSANGSDPVRIQAFLDPPAPAAITVELHATAGKLTPNELVIAAGRDTAEAILTSTSPGPVTVRYVKARPPRLVKCVEGETKEIVFATAIKELRLRPAAYQMWLGVTSTLGVELVGINSPTVVTDEPREVRFTRKSGMAELKPESVLIPAGKDYGSTQLTALTSGPLAISASTFGASTEKPETLQVSIPTGALAATLFGGMIGGALAGLRRKPRDKTNILIKAVSGAVVAFVFYWSCRLGLLAKVPAELVTNPFGTGVVAILGGWGGWELLDLILGLLVPSYKRTTERAT